MIVEFPDSPFRNGVKSPHVQANRSYSMFAMNRPFVENSWEELAIQTIPALIIRTMIEQDDQVLKLDRERSRVYD